ncbi:hypothetical protein G7K_5799-t1 [Saitoella complicata NRRL Y-17804]|uniref:Uncharacterized protein n=2 Tax=Saitoella complicata (strain BCRC 22490 / CBS 7301 / JCM 7358 / NBRC 10748 / NRRL Y-17804) TaxID=698492 RepID=A0A0E9NPT9_SAICN|nr:hypothetical protein G7K_5799-t1 [Saitoella complicata NRRL Y-17804]
MVQDAFEEVFQPLHTTTSVTDHKTDHRKRVYKKNGGKRKQEAKGSRKERKLREEAEQRRSQEAPLGDVPNNNGAVAVDPQDLTVSGQSSVQPPSSSEESRPSSDRPIHDEAEDASDKTSPDSFESSDEEDREPIQRENGLCWEMLNRAATEEGLTHCAEIAGLGRCSTN